MNVFEKVQQSALARQAAKRLAPGGVLAISGVWGSFGPMLAVALGRLAGAPVLLVTAHLDEADEAADDVEVFTGRPAHLFPAWEVDIGTDHLNDEVAGERLRLCNLLSQPPSRREEPVECVAAPVMALLQPVPSPQALAAARRSLNTGDELDLEELCAWLVDADFERVEQVDRQGEFARRGGIVDIFPPGIEQAVRIEFFGDRIESVRRFDLDTQRSTVQIDGYELTAISAGRQSQPGQVVSLLSYLSPETIICLARPGEVTSAAADLYRRLTAEGIARPIGLADDGDQPAGEEPDKLVFEPSAVFAEIGRFAAVEMHPFGPPGGGEALDMGVRSLERLHINPEQAMTELESLTDRADVWVYCENAAEQRRFGELLGDSHSKLAGAAHLAVGHVHSGFHFPAERLVVAGHHEVFHRYTKRRHIRRVRAGRPIESLLDLQVGDYVVHVGHGIARFEGLKRLQRDEHIEEYLTLRFAQNALLHVPASRINLVQKYIGARRFRPTLSHLGGVGWERRKQQVAEAVYDLAAEMLRIQAVRQGQPGESFPAETPWQRQFAEAFVYTETEDQIASMEQIQADLTAPRPMDRLLCGDVGYGKTELAMRAAFAVAEANKQSAVLVPTTVLADQHYRTFKERFADYPVNIEVLSRFRTPAEQSAIVKDLATGGIDIIIGTHRLLSGDVKFADLGLAIIDEEQRFGVEHKEHLKSLRANVDVLTMTATPIPRTLHMALLGLRDISALATPPLDRRAIHTEVCHYSDRLIRQSILRELNRQGQVFFVHNRVMDIQSLADQLHQLVPEARIAVAHGQMPEGELEETMLHFIRQEADVLVCTTIIESGLDIRTANTMIIHNADRFGLAELHQLRGRVGRYKHHAFCYLLLPETRPVTAVAAKRLKAIEEFSDLGAGFQIAMRDLEIRGAGNILGKEQSGHIAAVGYELYCQFLEKAVGQLQGKPAAEPREVHVELGVDAYIPRSYVPSERQRMEIYRRLTRCERPEELAQLRRDLEDAYGAVSPAVDVLLEVGEIRVHAQGLGIDSIIRMDPDLIFSIHDHGLAKALFDGAAGSVRLADEWTLHWRPPPAYMEPATLRRVLLKRMREALGAPMS